MSCPHRHTIFELDDTEILHVGELLDYSRGIIELWQDELPQMIQVLCDDPCVASYIDASRNIQKQRVKIWGACTYV